MSIDESSEHYDRLVDAIVARLGVVGSEDLLRSLTDRSLADAADTNPARVRRVFSRGDVKRTESMDRAKMMVAAVRRVVDQHDAVSRENNSKWVRACERLDAGDGLEAFLEVMAEDLDAFTPAADKDQVNARERVLRLAFALADSDDPRDHDIPLELRRVFDNYDDQYHEAYDALFRAFGRRLAAGVELAHLQAAMYAILDHAAVLSRIGSGLEPLVHLDMMMRVFWAYSTPIGEEDRHPMAELMAATRGGLGPREDAT